MVKALSQNWGSGHSHGCSAPTQKDPNDSTLPPPSRLSLISSRSFILSVIHDWLLPRATRSFTCSRHCSAGGASHSIVQPQPVTYSSLVVCCTFEVPLGLGQFGYLIMQDITKERGDAVRQGRNPPANNGAAQTWDKCRTEQL